jgi:phosphoribosylamine--glycine ligase
VKILVIGSGSKEHALVWKLLASEKYRDLEILAIPGNKALRKFVQCVEDVDINDINRILEIAIARQIHLTIVGESKLLAKGIVDKFQAAGKLIFGPSISAAEIESSNVFAKDFMMRHNIPSARYACFDQLNMALTFAGTVEFPIGIRTDKKFENEKSYFIAEDLKEARAILKELFKQKFLAVEKPRITIEELIEGHQFTLNFICDGKRALSLLPVQGYRDPQNLDIYFDRGAYAPSPLITDQIMYKIRHSIINPLISGLEQEGRPYSGILALDLALDIKDRLQVKLIQCRTNFADSDAQVVLPLLDEDIFEVYSASANNDLSSFKDGFHKYLGSALSVNIVNESEFINPLNQLQNSYMLDEINEHMDKLSSHLSGIPLVFYGTKSSSTSPREKSHAEIFGATAVAESLLDAQILAYKLADTLALPSKSFKKDIGDQGMI